MEYIETIKGQLNQLLEEFERQVTFQPKQLLVIGCSTSEVLGQRIGTSGTLEVGEVIYELLSKFSKKHGLYIAFQGCEHINRALTLEREAAEYYRYEPVTVTPVRTAGGAMSAYAYTKMSHPVVVENIRAHAGIDIGQTMIGMHLKEVAVPIRTSVKTVGEAIITLATTRPKLIGGERAQYTLNI
ncbi:TIGR01440 family protein [Lysinibacillus sp. 54212]|uniref:TIGR01440 family protein n=1 Tax=Lysinibacillus sp. 54212 TaxID=3119829 RepID=UPI002FCC1E71